MDSDDNVLRGHRVDAWSDAPPGRTLFCVRFQVPRSRARLHLANVRCPSGAGTNRPDGTMDISRGQMSLLVPPPVTIAESHSPRTGRWNGALAVRSSIGEQLELGIHQSNRRLPLRRHVGYGLGRFACG